MSSLLSIALLLIITLLGKSNGNITPDGKAVLITGCDSSFGSQLAKQINELGFKVYATFFNLNSAGALDVKQNAINPDKMIVLQLDVTKDNDVNGVYKTVKEDLSKSGHILWALINNAGITTFFPLEWGTLDGYRPLFDINVFGVVHMSRVFMPLLRTSRGRIVNLVGIMGRFSIKGGGAYSMSKHAIAAFTDVLRQEVCQFGIKVVSIEPGLSKRGAFSVVNQSRPIEEAYNTSPNEVKQVYERASKEKARLNSMINLLQVMNLDTILDNVVDSIVSRKPKAIYRSHDIPLQVLYYLHILAPPHILDYIMELVEKVAPVLEFGGLKGLFEYSKLH